MTSFKNLLRSRHIIFILILPFLSACDGGDGSSMSLQSDVPVIHITADETGQFQSYDFNFEILNNNSII